jgi:AraC family transcriptional regulator of adaptative response/methylated-DNA-[protein]-cysteine methyltransferase
MQMTTIETMSDTSGDIRWQALERRDPAADGTFIVGVASTGIYCRPGCPSRLPLRRNVRFFDTASDAAAAGFRACLRCRPDDALAPAARLAAGIREWIDAQGCEPVTLAAISAALGVSPGHAQRTFKRIYGLSPAEYARARRLGRFREAVRDGADVTTALYEAGYGSSSRLYEQAAGALGMTPGTYARGGRGAHIRYAVVESWIGLLVVAATERGICAVGIADEEDDATGWLEREFPQAQLVRDNAGLEPEATALRDLVDGHVPARTPQLDLRGTAFQLAVWAALATIPPGETRTYSELAEAVGKPAAVRAVANACGDNPVPIVIPCHRVLRKGGGLGGYRWGTARKQALLEAEQRDRTG